MQLDVKRVETITTLSYLNIKCNKKWYKKSFMYDRFGTGWIILSKTCHSSDLLKLTSFMMMMMIVHFNLIMNSKLKWLINSGHYQNIQSILLQRNWIIRNNTRFRCDFTWGILPSFEILQIILILVTRYNFVVDEYSILNLRECEQWTRIVYKSLSMAQLYFMKSIELHCIVRFLACFARYRSGTVKRIESATIAIQINSHSSRI